MKYGLIGEKLGHSFSKLIHEKIWDYKYDLLELTRDELDSFLEERDFKGVNVTIPYKSEVISYLDEIDESADKIGAVNTIVNKKGKLLGYNTDYYGFIYTLNKHNVGIEGEKVIVLGNGGAAKAVITGLEDLKAGEIVVVGRTLRANTISFEDCYKDHTDAKVIVNATPVGMYPEINASPLNLESFADCSHVIDLIYNPLETKLLNQTSQMGMVSINGLEMLIAQAKVAAEYFLDTSIDNSVIDKIYKEIHQSL